MRSDIVYSLGAMSRYQSDLGENHWKVIKIILKYLRNAKDQWLIYGESDLKLMGFTDSNIQSDYDDSKSISGYIYTVNSRAICWKVSSSILWLTLFVRQNISWHPMLQRKLCGYESSSMSLEWHPLLMV